MLREKAKKCVTGVFPLCLLAVVCLDPLNAKGDPGSQQNTQPEQVASFFRDYCVACHGADLQEAELRLDNLTADFASSTTVTKWIEVMDRVNLGEMPPPSEPRPDVDEVRELASWIASELRRAEKQRLSIGGRVLMRRMNRTEYINTISDLLQIEFLPSEDPTEILPPDGTAEGFDKVSAALMLDPSLLDNYLTVAQQVAQKAIVEGPPPFETRTMRLDFGPDSQERTVQELANQITSVVRENDIGMMGETLHLRRDLRYPDTNTTIPVEGKYRIRFRAAGDPGEAGETLKLRIAQQHPVESLSFEQEFVIDAAPDRPQVYETIAVRGPDSKHWRLEFLSGRQLGHANPVYWHVFREGRDAGRRGDLATVLRLESRKKLEGGHDNNSPDPIWADPSKLPKLYLDWFEVEGPLYDNWPPQSHQLLLFKGDAGEHDVDYVREIFTQFLPRAFRRPVAEEEAEPYVELVAGELERGATFHDAVRLGLTAVLSSPAFLYIHEPDVQEAHESGTENQRDPHPINDYELASRLSYFLWSSMPDAELFELAESERLSDKNVLEAQVDRMLADPKAEAFVQGFGAQWLRTGEFRNFTPDEKLYPQYTPELGEAMVQESLAFFREVLMNDRPVHEFIDSDWTFLNEPLAKHYGIDGVTGDEFRRVELAADSYRGGLLGMAGIAMWGSDGNRTKPVSRAVYVREVLFNDPPDPPPPNVGEIEPNIEGEKLTVRERLIQHQQIESCAGCHRGLDPYGIALENFNVIGLWRDRQDGEDFRGGNRPEVDPSGRLPNGDTFETYDEYKALLLAQRDRLNRGLAEKMIVYAMGRPVEPSDRGFVDSLTRHMSRNDYTMRSLMKGLILSDKFLEK